MGCDCQRSCQQKIRSDIFQYAEQRQRNLSPGKAVPDKQPKYIDSDKQINHGGDAVWITDTGSDQLQHAQCDTVEHKDGRPPAADQQ